MVYIVRWQTSRDRVTVITSDDEVNELLKEGGTPLDSPGEVRVFISEGSRCAELAPGTPLYERVATAAAIQRGAH